MSPETLTPKRRMLVLAALLAFAAGWPAQATEGTARTVPPREGAYTREQAQRGDRVFRQWCSGCHPPATLKGAEFTRAWKGRTAYDLFEAIRTTMPTGAPGRLTRPQYAEIVAYLFRLNGLPAGARELPNDDGELQKIRIEMKPAPE